MHPYREKYRLIVRLASRQFLQRYKGSVLGVLWPFLSAVIQMAIYSFVFTAVFHAKWQMPNTGEPHVELPFWLGMFSGMVVFLFFSDMISPAPGMVLSVPNYVKKIRFPLAVLPIVNLLVAFTTAFIFLLLLALATALTGWFHWSILLVPLVFLQAGLWCLGLSWMLGAAGVFVRDLQQIVPFVLQLLMYASPIFFSSMAIPPGSGWRLVMTWNPLAFLVETCRNLTLWGISPQWGTFAAWTGGAALFACAGYSVFQRLRQSFADMM